MMRTIECNDTEFFNIKNGTQIFKIFDKKEDFEYLEKCILKNIKTNGSINIQITSVKEYKNLQDMLKIVNFQKFGKYKNENDFISFIHDTYDLTNGFTLLRIKNLDNFNLEINDDNLIELLDIDTLEVNTLGLSGCNVYTILMKNGRKAILKVQNIVGNDSLKDEYDVLKYLFGKMNIAEPFYYNKVGDKEYLLRECIEGIPLYNQNGFGYKLGKELKKIHNLYDKNCNFKKFSTEFLLENALDNIDVVYEHRNENFKDYTKNDLKEFLTSNKPENDSLIHGDFSLTNILVNDKNEYYYIDLGNLSISSKYFDIYVLKKSLRINNLDDEYMDFLKGYEIDDYDEKYIDWMSLIESSYS